MGKSFTILTTMIVICLIVELGFVSAIVEISKTPVSDVIIKDVGNPAIYDFRIHNLGPGDNFEFYNYLNFRISPVGTFYLGPGETHEFNVSFYPLKTFDFQGNYNIEYFIKGQSTSPQQDYVSMRFIPLAQVFDIGSESLVKNSTSLNIFIRSSENVVLDKVKVKFSSAFFEREEEFSLNGREKKVFSITLNPEDYKRLLAGDYSLNADIDVQGNHISEESKIKYVESKDIITKEDSYGLIINNNIIKKINNGNVVSDANLVLTKNIITRLFTSFSVEPDNVKRDGIIIYYNWNRSLKPGEDFEVIVKTNWLFPLLLVLLVIAVVIIARLVSRTHVVARKKVSFVRVKGKGGEFGLKVTVVVQAKNFVEKVNVIDRIPPMMKVYPQFSGEKPMNVDEKNKRITWRFDNLDKGEIRMMSYMVYSKLGVLGKFALPPATVLFEKDGDTHDVESNRAYFVTDQANKEFEEQE